MIDLKTGHRPLSKAPAMGDRAVNPTFNPSSIGLKDADFWEHEYDDKWDATERGSNGQQIKNAANARQ